MKRKLNIDTWNRKEHFNHFCQMEEPFFGVTISSDCTNAYLKSKELGISFFTYYLHKTLTAINAIESFRYRILNDDIYIFDQINVSATIMREDKTFGFSQIEYCQDLFQFAENTKNEITRIKNTTGIITRDYSENVIHFSTVPWINFTSFTHARSFSKPDSCPKISFGKMIEENDKKTMSMSINVHHGLMDGYHVGKFIDLFEKLMND